MTGKKLKELREKKDLTRKELAKLISASQEAIYAWENEIRPINGIAEVALLSVLIDGDDENGK